MQVSKGWKRKINHTADAYTSLHIKFAMVMQKLKVGGRMSSAFELEKVARVLAEENVDVGSEAYAVLFPID